MYLASSSNHVHKFNIELSRTIDFVLTRRFGLWTFFSHKTGVEWHDNRPIGDILVDQRNEHKRVKMSMEE